MEQRENAGTSYIQKHRVKGSTRLLLCLSVARKVYVSRQNVLPLRMIAHILLGKRGWTELLSDPAGTGDSEELPSWLLLPPAHGTEVKRSLG